MMNKTLSLFVLVPAVFSGINNISSHAQIPQGSFQEIYIEGYSNQVTQQLNQRINVNFIDIPIVNSSMIPNLNIQGAFLDNINNKVNQEINQNISNSTLIPFAFNNFGVNDFIGYDNILNGLQFSEQQAFIQGDNNSTNQLSNQSLTQFFILEPSKEITITDILNQLLEEQLLDSFQFTSQDTILFGDNNIVNQNITQTMDISIIVSNFNPLLITDTWIEENNPKPTQLTIQETFIDISDNNLITQIINQSIDNVSFIESNIFGDENYFASGLDNTESKSNSLIDFPIDTFLNEILNNTTIESKQINAQFLEVIGNRNKNTQKNQQVLDLTENEKLSELTISQQASPVSVSEPSNLKMIVVLLGIMGIKLCLISLR